MAKDQNNNNQPKKGFPGGMLLLFLAMILLFLTIQSLLSSKKGKVSFSHQLEHLVNLDLITPENSKMVADNDKLVTFSGKFREIETKEGSERYKYLSYLNENKDFTQEKTRLEESLDLEEKNVNTATNFFLKITGYSLPKNGLIVVSPIYDTHFRSNAIIFNQNVELDYLNLKSLKRDYEDLKKSPSSTNVSEFEKNLSSLIVLFRSPKLGIGDDGIKLRLKNLQNDFNLATKSENKIELFQTSLLGLSTVQNQLLLENDNVKLLKLRSVRNYLESLDQYNTISNGLEKNAALLSKARKPVMGYVWFFNNKEISTKTLEKQDPEAFSNWYAYSKTEWESFSQNKGLVFKAPDQQRNTVLDKKFKSQEPSPNYFSFLITLLPVAIVILLLYFVFSRQMKGMGSSAMNFGKSPAKLLTKETNKVTFKDVAGAEESKEELTEIVDFLKNPKKFTALGARIPKGVLLVGPPGTGKTLIAKAVAGEADRPFFTISGSDFVEMFVGVGASRVRDLFEKAKKQAPCIIFMDEIDAVGRHRGAGIGGGHDEREQTLNQLLVEMDGFDTKEGVILMAATNRPDILDKALLRPGRFDRRVVLDLPDIKGRFEILKVHARKIKIDPSVNLMDIARNTPGASGADLENILNEAALLAARKGRTAVTAQETREASDKVRFGKERRSLEMDLEEKKTTAYHESGHAIVGLKVEHCDPIEKVTIIPRGFSLGATHFMPKKNRLNYWRREIIDQLSVLMGGRAAEEKFLDDMSSGAQQDIAQASKLARAMVCEWGMTEELGTVSYEEKPQGGSYFGMGGSHEKMYSNETAQKIDKEVRKLIDEAHTRAKTIIEENKDKLQLMTDMLIEFETLDAKDVKEIMEGSWTENKKKERLKTADDLQKKMPPPPPPKKEETIAPVEEFPNTQET